MTNFYNDKLTYQFFIVWNSGNEICQFVIVDSVWSQEFFGELVGAPSHYEIPFFETEIGNLARPFMVIGYCLTLGERNKGLW